MNATVTPAVEPAHGLGLEWNTSDPVEVRRRIRAGRYHGHTGGLARGYVQANIAMLPAAYADEFARFCQVNPKPCPLLAMSEPGSPHLPEMAEDLDLGTDLPSYRIFRDGEFDGDVASVGDLWLGTTWWRSRSAVPSRSRRPSSMPVSPSGTGTTAAYARCT